MTRCAILTFLLLAILALCTQAPDALAQGCPPRYVQTALVGKTNFGYGNFLSGPVRHVMEALKPKDKTGSKVGNITLDRLAGDFDGDGRRDVLLVLRCGKTGAALASSEVRPDGNWLLHRAWEPGKGGTTFGRVLKAEGAGHVARVLTRWGEGNEAKRRLTVGLFAKGGFQVLHDREVDGAVEDRLEVVDGNAIYAARIRPAKGEARLLCLTPTGGAKAEAPCPTALPQDGWSGPEAGTEEK